jgi:hypothetical protein
MGTERHLYVDTGYRWVDDVPLGVWHLSGQVKLRSDRCLDTVMRLAGKEISSRPPERFINAMNLLMSGSNVQPPWSQVMPEREHRGLVKSLINEATVALDTLSRDYYVNTWVPQSAVLRSLQPARVDKARYLELRASAGNNAKVIESFQPDSDGMATIVDYDRFGTRTGRLTTASGPAILSLKREFRDMVVPVEEGGAIAYVDFAALEARVLLYEAGGRCEDADMYTFISRELFAGTASRNAIKQAVISELYGSGKHSLGEVLGIEGKELNDFVGKVKRFFRTKELLKRVKDEFIKTGHVTNRYGRSLLIEEPLDHILINTYAQSTGVDVSLLGFSELVNQFSGLPGVRPIFVLHDALLLDVAPDCIDIVKSIDKVRVPGYVNYFPLKCEFITCTR